MRLIIVLSVTSQVCFEHRFKKSISRIGLPENDFIIVFTNAELTLSQSYNTILSVPQIKETKYILFVAQDVEFMEDGWGKKLIDFCDQLPDLGYAGVECKGFKGEQINYQFAYTSQGISSADKISKEPINAETCDGAIAIIPTKMFLEHQFDESFPWFPLMEDYVLWVRLIKRLEVYSIPLVIENGCSGIASKWVKQFKTNSEYANHLSKEYDKLLRKWNIKIVHTTCWG